MGWLSVFMLPPEKSSDPEEFDNPSDSHRMPTKTIYSVSELTARIKSVLEARFPFVWICGEISNFRMPSSGHSYFTLKDENAQIAAVVFRGQHRQAPFTLEDGMSIIGLGRLSVYEPRGTYQIILEYIEPAGLGALQLVFEKLKKRLAAEGFFDPRHKKPLPFLPKKISVITSPTGAVVHDILTVLNRRFSNLWVEIVPVSVQGPRAETEICAALDLVNKGADSDVIILARGGGSIEDLHAFNAEAVAMAIFNSEIPVVSAIGHETDVTIADFISDLRAPTPSAAAELIVPEKSALIRRLSELDQDLRNGFLKGIEKLNNDLRQLYRRLQNPKTRIQETWIRLDDMAGRLGRLLTLNLKHSSEILKQLSRHLYAVSPQMQVNKHIKKLELNNNNLLKNILIFISKQRSLARELEIKLEALNPLAILDRGYSVTRSLPDKRIISNPAQVSLNQEVEILLAGGFLLCGVKGKSNYGEENL
jgi:exodeoxyribonuclease VII large subunit